MVDRRMSPAKRHGDLLDGFIHDLPMAVGKLVCDIGRESLRLGVHSLTGTLPPRPQAPAQAPASLRGGDIPLGIPLGSTKPLYLPLADVRSKVVQGASGMGKTEWAIWYIVNRAKLGLGTAYLENTDGAAARRILDALPPECLARTVVIDHSDKHYPCPVGLASPSDVDPLDQDDITNMWLSFFVDSLGVEGQFMTQELISYVCRAVFTLPRATLLETILMVSDQGVREAVLRRLDPVHHRDVMKWWDRFDGWREDKRQFVSESFMRRASIITSQRKLRHTLCQIPKHPYPYREWMDRGYTVIIICRESMGRMAVRTTMSLHMLNLWAAALGRDDTPQGERPPFMVVADEPQTWMPNNTQIVDDVFSKGRKYGFGITCLIQSSAQVNRLSPALVEVIADNKPDMLVFRCETPIIRLPSSVRLDALNVHQFYLMVGDHEPIACRGMGRAPSVADRGGFAREQLEYWGQPWQEVAEEVDGRMSSWSTSIVARASGSRRSGLRHVVRQESSPATGTSSGSSIRTSW